MIVITGGAGFIGSVLVWKLNREGIDDILIVDQAKSCEKQKNLEDKKFRDIIDKRDFRKKVKSGKCSEDSVSGDARARFELFSEGQEAPASSGSGTRLCAVRRRLSRCRSMSSSAARSNDATTPRMRGTRARSG